MIAVQENETGTSPKKAAQYDSWVEMPLVMKRFFVGVIKMAFVRGENCDAIQTQ